jgi:hypothetical protein
LKLLSDDLLSTVAFEFNLRRCIEVSRGNTFDLTRNGVLFTI